MTTVQDRKCQTDSRVPFCQDGNNRYVCNAVQLHDIKSLTVRIAIDPFMDDWTALASCGGISIKMVGIYKITSPTGRVYIGQSLNLESRTGQYSNLKYSKSQPRLNRSFEKHGFESHTIQILEECTIEELNERERFYQDKYLATGNMGLNCMLTSSRDSKLVFSQETIDKMSAARKGKRMGSASSFYGRKHSPESIVKMLKTREPKMNQIKEKISNYSKNRTEEHRRRISIANTGHVHSEEQKRKISLAVSGIRNPYYGKTHSEEARKKMSERSPRLSGGKNPNAQRVRHLLTGLVHGSISEAAAHYGHSLNSLKKKLSNVRFNDTNLEKID